MTSRAELKSLIKYEDDFELSEFVHTGFNSHILNIGDTWQFWECYTCGNATASEPVKCEKCNNIKSFVFRNLLRLKEF